MDDDDEGRDQKRTDQAVWLLFKGFAAVNKALVDKWADLLCCSILQRAWEPTANQNRCKSKQICNTGDVIG